MKDTSGMYFDKYRDKVKACPCCGHTNLYIGHMSSDTMGVHCWLFDDKGCGLALAVDMYSNPHKGKTRTREDREDAAVREAIRRWNRRA